MVSDKFSIARSCAFAEPKPIGWGSGCGDILSHEAPLTEKQWFHLLHCGVIRTDAEVKDADAAKVTSPPSDEEAHAGTIRCGVTADSLLGSSRMDTIDARLILDAGVANLHSNHPDALVRRTTLATLLVNARAVRSTEAGILAFRIWASPNAKALPPTTIFEVANDKAPS